MNVMDNLAELDRTIADQKRGDVERYLLLIDEVAGGRRLTAEDAATLDAVGRSASEFRDDVSAKIRGDEASQNKADGDTELAELSATYDAEGRELKRLIDEFSASIEERQKANWKRADQIAELKRDIISQNSQVRECAVARENLRRKLLGEAPLPFGSGVGTPSGSYRT